MKKATWLFSSVIAALLTTGAPAVVSAAESSGPGDGTTNLSTTQSTGFTVDSVTGKAEADSTAEVVVNPGTLSLYKVPNLNFGSVDVQKLIGGGDTLALKNGALSSDAKTFDGDSEQIIGVQDYRGTNAGWVLTASLSNFSGDKGGTIKADNLSLSGDLTSKAGTLGTFDQDVKITDQDTTVLSAAKDGGTGDNSLKLNNQTQLVLPAVKDALAGTYQAKVVWTLSVVPTT